MYILQVIQEPYTMLPKKSNQYRPQHATMHQLLFYVTSKYSNLFTNSNMHPQNRQPSKEAGATHTADLMHALMQRSTIILHLHHQFKDGLIHGLINNVTWIDDMAQGVALIPPLNYKYPLTPSHSTHHKGSPPYHFPRCKNSLA